MTSKRQQQAWQFEQETSVLDAFLIFIAKSIANLNYDAFSPA